MCVTETDRQADYPRVWCGVVWWCVVCVSERGRGRRRGRKKGKERTETEVGIPELRIFASSWS